MKTKKLNLSDLKVTSFVTALDENNAKTVQGGIKNVLMWKDTDAPCTGVNCTHFGPCPASQAGCSVGAGCPSYPVICW